MDNGTGTGVEIGEHGIVEADNMVTGDVLPFSLVYGNPAKAACRVSKGGHRLLFQSDEAVCPGTGERYRLINSRVQPVLVLEE